MAMVQNDNSNPVMFMDDIKLFAKNDDQIDTLLNTVTIFSAGHQNEVWLTKFWVLIMKRVKLVESEGINMPDGKTIKNNEEGEYK